MAKNPGGCDDARRLRDVQTRVRELVHGQPQLADAIRDAWRDYCALQCTHLRAKCASRGQDSEAELTVPPSPTTLERAELSRFSAADRRTIVLTRLAWLADVGVLLPLIPELPAPLDVVDQAAAITATFAVTPVHGVGDTAMESEDPSPQHFPPNVAEEFLSHLERWVKRGDFVLRPAIEPESESLANPSLTDLAIHADTKSSVLPPASAELALTADHESILAVLGKGYRTCMTVNDVAGAGTIRNRETVGRLLGELAGLGLVNRPYGIRKGYALTDEGRKRVLGATPT